MLAGQPCGGSLPPEADPEPTPSLADSISSGFLDRQNDIVKAPLKHMPKGAQLMPGFPGPQFKSLGPSLRYRRRLRRHRRNEGWNFSNLPGKRNLFAARRNHRDQLMHRWMYTRHTQCKRRAREILSRLRLQSKQIFGDQAGEKEEGEGEGGGEAQATTSPSVCTLDLAFQPSQNEPIDAPSQNSKAPTSTGDDCIAAIRAALKACPPPAELNRMSAEALGLLHATLRELLVDALVAVAPPAWVASAASAGFSLPPATAALAASPIPWWNSGRGLQPWRGRKEARAQLSRWVNWASPRRNVEPTVAGILLPEEAAAVVAAERKARNQEVVQTLREFLLRPRGETAESELQSSRTNDAETKPSTPVKPALPRFILAEDERLQRLLPRDATAKKGAPSFLKGEWEGAACRGPPVGGGSERQEGGFGALRRALGAAIDVALHLTEASITKKKGAAAPYTWSSPFLKSSASSKRRRWREKGRPPPGELRMPSRQARRTANRDRPLAAVKAAKNTIPD
ncbi:hypothetical protein Esti_001716 [Eimeria stiedai]